MVVWEYDTSNLIVYAADGSLTDALNRKGAEGWELLRMDMTPVPLEVGVTLYAGMLWKRMREK